MISFEIDCNPYIAAALLAEVIGEREFWLHRSIGGKKWRVEVNSGRGKATIHLDEDVEHMISYVLLRLQK